MRILVVEDSVDIQELLEQILESEGHELFFAENGLAGLDLAIKHRPDLILMDLSLPVMTGWDAVRRLREMNEFKTTPIVAMTAHASKSDRQKALDAGCTSYISKPFDMDAMLKLINNFA